eukprot:TRINITY_DN3775_c0_g1_i1.p1 TRINITY_DN3775_c0_g1~~TRINITY_DN3775_c0_g1_i1.p1  ORF type:complete len:600 (-),score=119.06 TRINITY_DN3775_c0_g1_i1:39-1838(-)
MIIDSLIAAGYESFEDITTDHMYPCPPIGHHKGSFRVHIDEDTNTIQSGLIKIKEKHIDFPLLKEPYDIRIGLAKEIRTEPRGLRPDEWQVARLKNRISFEHNDAQKNPWRIDLTQVTSIPPKNPHISGREEHNQSGKVTYEVEMEIIEECWEFFDDDAYLEAKAEDFLDRAMDLLKIINNHATAGKQMAATRIPAFNELACTLVNDDNLDCELRECVSKAFRRIIPDFPGSMPVTFSRRHFETIHKADYLVSEKTDGLRFLLLVCPKGCFLIDRKYAFYRIEESNALFKVLSPDRQQITLIDGELVRHLGTHKAVYLMFDLISLHGKYYGEMPLRERLRYLYDLVTVPMRNFNFEGDSLPFEIERKNFQNKGQVAAVFTQIIERREGGSIHREFKDERRWHRTDGLILAPNEPYETKTVSNLFKWKYPDMQSIDFRAVPLEDRQFAMYASIKGGETIECFKASFPQEDMNKLKDDWKRLIGDSGRPVIMECTYDAPAGSWRYHTLRPDKTTPNYIRVVFDTLLVIAEGVGHKELIYKITPEKDRAKIPPHLQSHSSSSRSRSHPQPHPGQPHSHSHSHSHPPPPRSQPTTQPSHYTTQ